MQETLKRIEDKLDELLRRSEPKTRPKKIKDTRTLEEQLEPLKGRYSPREIEKFISYWSEGNRWQKEKTWEIEKRLKRWMMNVEDRNWEKTQKQVLKTVEEKPIHRETQKQIDTGFSSIGSLFNRV